MREANVYHIGRALPRMSWHPRNLYNLWCRSVGAKGWEIRFNRQNTSLFKQRWTAKSFLRAYHGDHIKETIFKRWYLPATLPDVRRQGARPADAAALNRWARREDAAAKDARRREEELRKGLAPVGSLMFAEVERRLDVLVFRSCFAQSVYEARRLVVHGHVLLNGKKHTNPNARLAPGDMFSVDPGAVRILQPRRAPKTPEAQIDEAGETDEAAAEAYAESEAASEAAHAEAAAAAEAATPSAMDKWKTGTSTSASTSTDKDTTKAHLTPFHLPPYASPFLFVPAYLEPSFATCSAVYVRHPTARPGYSEIPTPYDADGELMRMAWEWYAKRRSRIRSKSQLARMPENRQ